ncbi:hypothetical protein QQA16_29330, partial [Klebsiella pneumoniae]|nr:hypothetical protein [Klebsiella pneumoniae]
EQEGQQTETEATGAPQKHHYTLNQQVGSITEIFARIGADLVGKVFSVNIKQINNIVHSNVCVIPIQTQAKQVNFAAGVMASCFKNF